MKSWILIIFGVLNIVACKAQNDYAILEGKEVVETLKTTYKAIPASASPTELSNSEFIKTEKLMTKAIEDYNLRVKEGFKKRGEKKKHAKRYQIMDLEEYKIQYVPYLNANGQKEVWINGFCNDFESDWKNQILSVFDGGNCFFTIRLNLETGECLEIGTNGYA